jgi:hypothetical protein
MFRKLRARRDTPQRGNSGEISYEYQFQGYSPGIQLSELQGRWQNRRGGGETARQHIFVSTIL